MCHEMGKVVNHGRNVDARIRWQYSTRWTPKGRRQCFCPEISVEFERGGTSAQY